MEMHIVVAMAQNNVIGVNNSLPWKLPADLKHFKALTMGHPMVMGRLTYESIGRPLPGRTTIVVTRDEKWRAADGVIVCHSLNEALSCATELAADDGLDKFMIVGGANIYTQLIEKADVLHVTEVELDIEGDAFFPQINKAIWKEFDRQQYPASSGSEPSYAFVSYKKMAP
ncbi:dihydrofolate reductase [Agaribacterium haliotis]|uniref:dihydrofolate reductase n=1 Tax=Agaribacterium haliotis TaxID=2013869 RepID=UPI000BB57D36|nr:dihydrofolate reductase [Agaribacterium haliotis]